MKDPWVLIGKEGEEKEVSVLPEKYPPTIVKSSGYHAKLEEVEVTDSRRSYKGPEGWTVFVPDSSEKPKSSGGREK